MLSDLLKAEFRTAIALRYPRQPNFSDSEIPTLACRYAVDHFIYCTPEGYYSKVVRRVLQELAAHESQSVSITVCVAN